MFLMVRFLVISNTDLLKSSSPLSASRNCTKPIWNFEGAQIYICRFLFSHLFNITKVEKVRGTPASGKSSLGYLLRKYIQDFHPELDVCMVHCYPTQMEMEGAGLNYRTWLAGGARKWEFQPGGVLILDEAQLSYWDKALWGEGLKTIGAASQHMVILFASYGSASQNLLLNKATPFIVKQQQLVGLVRGRNSSDLVGLLLTADEVAGVADKKFPDHQFDSTLLDLVYRMTSGHVGAYHDTLEVIKSHDVSLQSTNLEYER